MFYSYIFNFSAFDVRGGGANSCWVEKVPRLPETKLEAETGAPVHHILMEETKAKMLCSTCWKCLLTDGDIRPANVTSFGLEKGGEGTFNVQWHEGDGMKEVDRRAANLDGV